MNNAVMKKTYITPELEAQLVHTEGLIAISLQSSKADNSDALVKEYDWDIFGEYSVDE
jgi:hypothetical protein